MGHIIFFTNSKKQSQNFKLWAIFWYSTIFNKQGLCINPIKSMTKNIDWGKMQPIPKRLKKY